MENEDAQKMRKRSRIADWLRGTRETSKAQGPVVSEKERLRQEIEKARQEWALARHHIDSVSDPELIDHAIYFLEAAERKYGYLLREAKKQYAKERQLQVEGQA